MFTHLGVLKDFSKIVCSKFHQLANKCSGFFPYGAHLAPGKAQLVACVEKEGPLIQKEQWRVGLQRALSCMSVLEMEHVDPFSQGL